MFKNCNKFNCDLSEWNVSKVTDMRMMFFYTGKKSSLFKLNCSNWNVDKVTSYSNFNDGVTSKVTPPQWK